MSGYRVFPTYISPGYALFSKIPEQTAEFTVFDLLRSIFDKDLSQYVGINALMYNVVKTTGSNEIRFTFGQNGYGFELRPNNEGSMIFGR